MHFEISVLEHNLIHLPGVQFDGQKMVKFVLSQRGARMPTYGRTSGVLILSVGALLGISEVSHHLPLLHHSIIAAVPHETVSTCGSWPCRPPPKSGLPGPDADMAAGMGRGSRLAGQAVWGGCGHSLSERCDAHQARWGAAAHRASLPRCYGGRGRDAWGCFRATRFVRCSCPPKRVPRASGTLLIDEGRLSGPLRGEEHATPNHAREIRLVKGGSTFGGGGQKQLGSMRAPWGDSDA